MAPTRAPAPDAPPLLRMRGIDKSFPGVRALRSVDLTLHAGEVLALLGENGAGKSTLIKVLSGAHRADAGTIEVGGVRTALSTPADAHRAGIAVIYQEFNLVPALTARDNLFLGRDIARGGFIRHAEERTRTAQLFARIGLAVAPDARVRDLSIASQQVVEIAKALGLAARILVMDEPSATLTDQEVEKLFAIIGDLTRHGMGVIYVSHRLDEIFRIADRVTVLRDGVHVGTHALADVDRHALIGLMVGRTLKDEFPQRTARPGAERLVVRGLSGGDLVRDVSFSVRRGEILALTGLVGAGRTETARLVFGADRPEAGTITLDGRTLRIRSPRDAIRHGICLLTEDRQGQGLVPAHTVRENFALPNLRQFARGGLIARRREYRALERFVSHLRIKIPGPEERAANLSGGNQQKLVLAKWLQAACQVLMFDEHTRGIDVGAKFEIYQLMNALAAQGKAVIMISSELPEVLGMADRILVMRGGRIAGEIADAASATQEQIMHMAMG